ncbi:MAG: tetratricopeptide repeat protein [Geobacteraceae bacterium]|nr:tetratricopeptide repeat protein [Geobacteraceae bacterium]
MNNLRISEPNTPEAWFNQGISCMEKGDYGDAEQCFRQTRALAPGSLEAVLNLGYALDMQGHSEEALNCYESVLAISPENAKARYNRAAHLLRKGELAAGFADYEARFEAVHGTDNRIYSQPRWEGTPLEGKTILVYAEQGLGDAMMFGRYIPMLADRGGRVVLELQPPLLRLFASLHGVERVVAKSDVPPVTDFHIPLLSLPHLFRTTMDTIPSRVPYIAVPEKLVDEWREKIADKAIGCRIGLVWAGKERPYPNRSCPPDALTPLLFIPGVSYFLLQAGEKDRFPLPEEFVVKTTDLTDDIGDFADTAALIANLDLVITIDTSVAHLAGAMGKPVWAMLPFASDWRWMLDRSDSPWYPTMRLFRQSLPGDWGSVVNEINRALYERLSAATDGSDSSEDMLECRFQGALKSIEDAVPERAITELTDLLAHLPDNPSIWFNLGRAYDLTGQPAQALRYFRQALFLNPGSPSIWLRLGDVFLKQRFPAEAEACLQKAHVLAPGSIDILLSLGAALFQLGKTEQAFDCCRKMLSIDPNCVEAAYNLAYLQLRSGDYRAGFANFEARLAMKALKIDDRSYSQPRWDGSPLAGRSILIFGEQGLGDVIQFSRYLPLVAERGGRVILEIDPPLIPLFSGFSGVSQVVAKSDTPPLSDVYAQLLSLPFFFGTTPETVPNMIPYISPDAAKAAEWRQLLSDGPAYRVGFVWRGSPRNPLDQDRSCPLAMFSPLAALVGIRFYSLQVGAGSDEIISPDPGIELVDHTGRLSDLSDTAAFIANLDLVIGVDTAVVHLAGAMGKPVWIMLSRAADWRWIVGRHDSPWYPTARVFWQEQRGDWGGTISCVKDALAQLLGEKEGGHEFGEIESLYNLGSRIKDEGDLVGAERCFRRIIDLDPDLPDPQHGLGVVLQMQGRPQEAVAHYKTAIAQDPGFVQALYNLANALVQSGKPQEALEYVRAVLRCDAAHADAHWLLGMLLLLRGDYSEGWAEYEWRWQARAFLAKIPDLGRPLWDGAPLEGRTLLIQMEQGRGDMIQFVRFAPMAAAMGGRVIVRAVPDLVPLLSNAEGVSLAVDQNGPMPDFDVYIPALSLPHVLGTTLETLPAHVPYLRPDPDRVVAWQREIPADGRFRIGLAWQGSSENRDNQNRSCALAAFQPLADLAGVVFFSLQIGAGCEQISPLAGSLDVIDVSGRIHDYADTAAFVENLDLVISVCTSVAHLAGALGRPVWTLLHFASDWRWLLERSDSPWYPSMRLFRQAASGDWAGVIAGVKQELAQLLATPGYHNQRGVELLQKGEVTRAERAFSRAVELDQEYAEAYCNRGAALYALDRLDDALTCYQAALLYQPDLLSALFNMGNAYRSLGKLDHAQACYQRVCELNNDFIPAYLCLGEIAKEMKAYGQARTYYDQALSINVSCVDAIRGLAEICQAEEKYDEAARTYRMALAQQPDLTAVWNQLGTVYHSLERLEEAESCYRQALDVLPDQSAVLNNLGVVLIAQGCLDGAVEVLHHLVEIDAGYAEGHWNLSVALLALGRYLEGWREYEWRFRKVNPVPERSFLQPRWDGVPLDGRTILLHAEQGFGDTFQFVRYVPVLAKLGGTVILECQVPALKRLLLSLDGVAEVVVAGDPLPSFDYHLPLMSLPLAFGTTVETIPAQVPYLAADPADVGMWSHRLGPPTKFRVGLVWHAKQSQVLNRKRSCPLHMFAPLWDVSDVEFYTLQVGAGAEQLEDFRSVCAVIDHTPCINDFADTAAFMANLDLIITIDTAAAHLAGALGVPTWVVLPHVAEWRWLCRRQDSPWYPSMRLFRQPSRGNWPALMSSVVEALRSCARDYRCRIESKSAAPRQTVEVCDTSGQLRAGLRVGLAWAGRQDNPLNRKRSCPFDALAPLFDVPNVTFVSLQLDAPDGVKQQLIDLSGHIHDFEDTAALMANLDLIISIDTSVAHLAAASGRPTWVLLSHVADWRWLTADREDSPWYPGIHLFRQPDHGDWGGVIRKVTTRLAQLSGNQLDWRSNSTTPASCAGSPERQLLEQQLERYQGVVCMNTSCPDAHLDVGASLALLGRYKEAVASFRHVVELKADHVAGHLNLAYALLALGEYPEGWQHLEWRLQRIPAGQLPPWPMLLREQLGTHSSGTTVMVHCEQGYGDTIQFSRFLPMLAEAGYRVIVSCQPPMAPLIASIRGVGQVVPHGELLPVCNLQVLLLSLPGLFSTAVKNIPAEIPYLTPQQQCVEAWKSRLEAVQKKI